MGFIFNEVIKVSKRLCDFSAGCLSVLTRGGKTYAAYQGNSRQSSARRIEMGNEVSFLSTGVVKIWTRPMALGFLLPHDRLVETQRHKLHPRSPNYAAKASQERWKNSWNDILGQTIHRIQPRQQTIALWHQSNRHNPNANDPDRP